MPSRPAVGTQDELRRHNLSSLLSLVHTTGATSRSDLTARTGLNRSTVKALTEDLVAVGILRERAPVGRGNAGRPSIAVEPESRLFVLALDIGVEHLIAMRIGLGGVVLDRADLAQTSGDYGVRSTVGRVESLARRLLDSAPRDATCIGIGIGVCGVVSSDDGVVRFAPNLGWVDVPLRELVGRALRTPLRIEVGNDGDLGALAEHLRGVGRGVANMVFISGEVGIGGGIILDGRPMRGIGGYGGEIGHMSIDPRGRRCRCGRRGCWETAVGLEALLLATHAPPGAALADVLTAYAAGERWPQAGMRRVGRALGAGVVNLVNLFNPELIVFGGASRHIFRATEDLVRGVLQEGLEASRSMVRLEMPELGDDAIAVGAAEVAFAALLDDPIGSLSRLSRAAS